MVWGVHNGFPSHLFEVPLRTTLLGFVVFSPNSAGRSQSSMARTINARGHCSLVLQLNPVE